MRKILLTFFVLCLLVEILKAQTPSFESYSRISNSEFSSFVSLFEEKSLPYSTDDLFVQYNLKNLSSEPISQDQIDQYLYDEGDYIFSPLYTVVTDPGVPESDIYGSYYPLFKLPTSGDYVMLAVAQVDDAFNGYDKVLVLSYDLNGNFKYVINYLYEAGYVYTNNYIDSNLISHQVYIMNRVNGELVFPPLEGQFSSKEMHSRKQITTNGTETDISLDSATANFQWDEVEFRFKKVN